MKQLLYILFFTFSIFGANSQTIDYTGVWNGKFYNNTGFGLQEDVYRFEVQIAQTGKGLEGVTYSYLSTTFYGKAGHNGFVKTDGKKIVIQETKMLELKSMSGEACLMTCTMKYSKVGENEFLEGTFTAIDAKRGTSCEGGYVKLQKIKKSIFGIEKNVQKKLNEIANKRKLEKASIATNKPKTTVDPKPKPPIVSKPQPKPPIVTKPQPKPPVVINKPIIKDTIKNKTVIVPSVKVDPKVIKPIPPAPTALKERKNELVQIIPVTDTNTLVIDFYDYGEVDGDIVSIYVNNILIVDKKMLGTKPIQVPIQLNSLTPEVTVVMYADNLGSVPPNTAYMVVRINGEKYDATIESTEQKNASVKFVYKGK